MKKKCKDNGINLKEVMIKGAQNRTVNWTNLKITGSFLFLKRNITLERLEKKGNYSDIKFLLEKSTIWRIFLEFFWSSNTDLKRKKNLHLDVCKKRREYLKYLNIFSADNSFKHLSLNF